MSIRKVALDALKTKFEGVDEKVLSRIATQIAKTAKTEDEATNEVEDWTLQRVIDSYTDSRVTDAQDKAVKGYEEKYGLKDGVKAGDGGAEPNNDKDPDKDPDNTNADKNKNQNNEAMTAVLAEMKALRGEIASLKAGKTTDTRKAQLESLLKDASEGTKKKYLREFTRSQFKDDADFDSWVEEITPEIEDSASAGSAQQQQPYVNPLAMGKPKIGGKGDSIPAGVQARIDARAKQAETVTSAIKGLPTTK